MIDMTIDETVDKNEKLVNIKVIGVGGAGGNAVNRMMESRIEEVEYIAVNTDAQALVSTKADIKIKLGEKGQGAGNNPQVAQKAAENSKDEILKAIEGAHMVFITAGMGGGTGTGAAPVIAKLAKEKGILTVAVVTMPFKHEMRFRGRIAEEGLANLEKEVDTIVIIKNERIKLIAKDDETVDMAFKRSDEVLMDCVNSVVQIIINKGMINSDFADVVAVMKDNGRAHMGIGRASGANRAEEAIKEAFVSPLLDHSIAGCRNCLYTVMGKKSEMKMSEYEIVGDAVQQIADENAVVIPGIAYSDSFGDDIVVTVIATGFDEDEIEYDKVIESNKKDYFRTDKSAEQAGKKALANSDFEDLFVNSDSSKKSIDFSDLIPKDKSISQDSLEVPDFLKA